MKVELKPNRSLEFYRNKRKHSTLYFTSIMSGVCIALYLFIFNFTSYIESMLISGTILWVFLIVFGYYGFVAQWIHLNFEKLKFNKPRDLFVAECKKLPSFGIRPIFNALHFPLYIPNKSPLFLALAGSFVWSIWLMLIFVLIIPKF